MVRFREILTILSQHDVEFVVVGGVAAVMDGAPFMTYDVDIVHRRTPENIRRLMRALDELGVRYQSRTDLAGHQLLKTAAGPLESGEIEGGLDYDALLASSRPVSIGPEITVQVPRWTFCPAQRGIEQPEGSTSIGLAEDGPGPRPLMV